MILVAKTCGHCGDIRPATDYRERQRGYHNWASACRRCSRKQAGDSRHGIDQAARLRLIQQQHGCALCGRTEPGAKGWVIDHDHACCSGEVSCADCRRGVLCQWCNNALGYANDDPALLRRMADYLDLGTRLTQPEAVT